MRGVLCGALISGTGGEGGGGGGGAGVLRQNNVNLNTFPPASNRGNKHPVAASGTSTPVFKGG